MTKKTIGAALSLVAIVAILCFTRLYGGDRTPADAPAGDVTPTVFVQASTPVPTVPSTPTPSPEPTATPVPTSTPTPTPSPEPTKPPVPTIAPEYTAAAQAVLDQMTVDEKIYQLFLVTPEQLTGVWPVINAYDRTKNAIRNKPVAGIIYASQNIESKNQLTKLLGNSQSYSKFGVFLAIHDETGSLTGIAGTRRIPKPAELGAEGNPDKTAEAAASLGEDLIKLGFNLNLSPVADITTNGTSFGSDDRTVATMVEAYVKGSTGVGMPCVLGHFPVQGTLDERSIELLRDAEFRCFTAGITAGASVVMVGYADMTALSEAGLPACMNPEVIRLLREELGFTGVVMTELFDATVIKNRFSTEEAVLNALSAGCDLILCPVDLDKAFRAVKGALAEGSLAEEQLNASVLRILSMKAQYGILKQ